MTLRGQYACVLAALLICLALTIGLVGAPRSAPRRSPAWGDDIPLSTRDVQAWDPKSSSAHSRVPNSIVPEGVAVLILTVVWTAGRLVLPSKLGLGALRRPVVSFGRRRSFG
jgi:hypothetical protein